MADKKQYGIEKCCCGHPSCSDYWLTGIGSFVQGSGFTREEAQRIADLLNADAMLATLTMGERKIAADEAKS